MTLDEAVAVFRLELPDWWWSVTECQISCHGNCGPDSHRHDDHGLPVIDVEIPKPSTPADVLMAMMAKVKAAKAARSR